MRSHDPTRLYGSGVSRPAENGGVSGDPPRRKVIVPDWPNGTVIGLRPIFVYFDTLNYSIGLPCLVQVHCFQHNPNRAYMSTGTPTGSANHGGSVCQSQTWGFKQTRCVQGLIRTHVSDQNGAQIFLLSEWVVLLLPRSRSHSSSSTPRQLPHSNISFSSVSLHLSSPLQLAPEKLIDSLLWPSRVSQEVAIEDI